MMKKYISILNKVKLFKEIENEDILSMLSCLDAKIQHYKKDEFLLIAGDKVEDIGILLKGNLHIIKENFEGERTIIATLSTGDYFAEALCCANVMESPICAIAKSNVDVLMLKFSRILHSCPNSCIFHTLLIQNMLQVIAEKNIFLQNRLEIISQKTLRLKVLHYLKSFSIKNEPYITIPLNREELSDFLCVDRSSLSHELSRMKQDGLIDYYKNQFKLL